MRNIINNLSSVAGQAFENAALKGMLHGSYGYVIPMCIHKCLKNMQVSVEAEKSIGKKCLMLAGAGLIAAPTLLFLGKIGVISTIALTLFSYGLFNTAGCLICSSKSLSHSDK